MMQQSLRRMASFLLLLQVGADIAGTQDTSMPPPPLPEPIEVVQLPLPPAIKHGLCTAEVNPNETGCMNATARFSSNSFTADGNHVITTITFAGAPSAPLTGSIYTGEQVVLVKADGTTFSNGDSWKCLTCGVSENNSIGRNEALDYPQAFVDGKRMLSGTNIIDCGENILTTDECTAQDVHIRPIVWVDGPASNGPLASLRELRLHPDNIHLGYNSYSDGLQSCFLARVEFNNSTDSPAYLLTNVIRLSTAPGPQFFTTEGGELYIDHTGTAIGELRGISGSGNEVTYIGNMWEASNIDVFARNLHTGAVRRLTAHPEYVDPVDISPDDQWTVVEDTRGTSRQMFFSAMRGIPPLTDLVAATAVASTRNNGERRFFQPWLIDRYGDRGTYFGQKINAAGDGSPGSINDPNWNARADPKFSPDGTRIAYSQGLAVSPDCGGSNPLPCPVSTEQGGRVWRVMVATLTSRKPKPRPSVSPLPDVVPWGTPYVPGEAPQMPRLPLGNFTHYGSASGFANVRFSESSFGKGLDRVAVTYHNFSNDGVSWLNGWEDVSNARSAGTEAVVDWFSDIVQTGAVNGTKKTSPEGFHLAVDFLRNKLRANGTLETTIDGIAYRQPANDT